MDTSPSWLAEPMSSLQRAFAQILTSSVDSHGNQGVLFAVMVLFTLALASMIWLVLSLGKKSTAPLPPGSFGLPIIGDTVQYLQAYQTMNTKKWFEEKKRKYGPFFKTSLLFQKTVFLDEPGGCKLMFGQPDDKLIGGLYSKSNRVVAGPNYLILENGQIHTTYRKYLISHFLGVDVVGRYLPIMEQKAIDHIQRYWLSKDDGTRLIALELLQMFTFSIGTELLLSFTGHDASIEKRKVELKEGTATPIQDYLSILLTHPDEQGQFHTDEQIRVLLANTLWAGSDTTAATMAMVLRAVSKHPEVYKELIQEHRQIAANKAEGELLTRQEVRSMKYTWAVIQETLRITPATTDISREAMADIPYKGYVIPKGYKLVCSAAQSMWNPDMYPNPERFDPSRFIRTGATKNIEPYTFFPFGGSTRYCPGQEFAKLNMLTFIHHFFKNIQYTLEEPEERVLYYFMVTPEKGLPLRIQKCKLY